MLAKKLRSRSMIGLCISIFFSLSTLANPSIERSGRQWIEGKHYSRIEGTGARADAPRVEMIEFFHYTCMHCYTLEPYLTLWLRSKPDYVDFNRIPVVYNRDGRQLARLYFTLRALRRVGSSASSDLHHEVFDEIMRIGTALTRPNDADAAKAHAAFAARFGIDQAVFLNTYHSKAVNDELTRAEKLSLRYRIDATPTVVVNGSFKANPGTAGGPAMLVALAADLAFTENKHRHDANVDTKR